MRVDTRCNYTSNREWFRNTLGGKDVVLCHTSALECLGLFPGYVNEDQIDISIRPSNLTKISINMSLTVTIV